NRADGERSWTVDIAARRSTAKQQADVLRSQAAKPAAQAEKLQEELKELKKTRKPDDLELQELATKAAQRAREANELRGKAQSIEDTAYDLKAVNPNAKNHEDTRMPEELLDFIEVKGREVEAALATLRKKSKDVVAP